MTYTETYFGLINVNGKISADNGKTYLPSYDSMSAEYFEYLIFDIENHIEKTLNQYELKALIELLK